MDATEPKHKTEKLTKKIENNKKLCYRRQTARRYEILSTATQL